MKHLKYLNLLTVAVLLSVGVVGCKKKVKGPTPIPTGRTNPQDTDPFGPGGLLPGTTLQPDQPVRTGEGLPPTGPIDLANTDQDREFFRANTVYFDFDRSTVKASEASKIEAVAAHLRGNAAQGVLVEGHCDERGTEQYNLSLGERRALAVREYLVNLGIDSQRVHTISYGEAQPAAPGHDESAWSKNRRGEFILLKPRQ